MLFFNRENQEQVYLNNLPVGRIYKQAFKKGSNFNLFVKWISSSFEWLVDTYNLVFKGLFICKSDRYIDRFKRDYNIPNEIFYATTKEEHVADIKVLKYLMQDNIKWNFEAIASQYGIQIEVHAGEEYYPDGEVETFLPYAIPHRIREGYYPDRETRAFLPHAIPHRIREIISDSAHILVVIINKDDMEADILPHAIPHVLGENKKVSKLKKIYDIIKEAHVEIVYLTADVVMEEIKICKEED